MNRNTSKKGQFTILIAALIFTAVTFLVIFTVSYFADLSYDMIVEVEQIDRHSDEMVLSTFLRMEDEKGEPMRRKLIDYVYAKEIDGVKGWHGEIYNEIKDLEETFQDEHGYYYYLYLEYEGETFVNTRPDDLRKEVASTAILLDGEVAKIVLVNDEEIADACTYESRIYGEIDLYHSEIRRRRGSGTYAVGTVM